MGAFFLKSVAFRAGRSIFNHFRFSDFAILPEASGMIRVFAAAWLLALMPLHAQLPNLLGKETAKPAAVAETPAQIRDRLQSSLNDAREMLIRLDDPQAEIQLPEGVSATEYSERRRDVQQLIASLERHLKSFAAVPDSTKQVAVARDARAEWQGFKEGPPYSVLMVDELRNKRDVAAEKQTTSESNLSLLGATLEEARQSNADAEVAVRRAQDTLDSNDKDLAAKWRLESAKIHQKMSQARVEGMALGQTMLQSQLAAAKDELSLIDVQIAAAAPQQAFLKDDLSKVRKSTADRQAALKKEKDALDKRRRAALADRRKLDPAPGPDGKAPAIDELTQLQIHAADTKVETLQFSMDTLESLTQMEGQMLDAYEFRNALMTSQDLDARVSALKSLKDIAARIKPWSTYAANQFNLAGAELRNQEARASSLSAGDPKLQAIGDEREALGEKMVMIQRMAQSVDLSTRQIGRWIADYDTDLRKQSWGERFSSVMHSTWGGAKKAWNYELFQVDQKGVTIRLLVIALALFSLGYLIAKTVTGRFQKMIVARGRVPEAQAVTLRRWLMLLIAFFLAIATLKVVKIPLTVFAFLGGALAIGLGFGTQTLIKNFISGIIMLFERNIRVGDIVDVGGSVGTVSEINTRSSIVRSADGLETLIPNSMFLENKVTNWTHSNRRLRRSVRLGVEYGSPSQKVAEVLIECAHRHGKVLKEPAPMALFEDFGDTALIFSLYFWIELAGNTNASLVASDLRFMIEKKMSEAGIVIPSPSKDFRLVTEAPLSIDFANRSGGESNIEEL